jgi:hypothetical protein
MASRLLLATCVPEVGPIAWKARELCAYFGLAALWSFVLVSQLWMSDAVVHGAPLGFVYRPHGVDVIA